MVILIETMRREGYEFCVGRPSVIFKYENGKKLEPVERLYVDCMSDYMGIVTEKLSRRGGRMIVGEHNRENDLNVNITKTKKLSNMRAAGKDENIILTPVLPITLERAIQFIREDELVEVTPG